MRGPAADAKRRARKTKGPSFGHGTRLGMKWIALAVMVFALFAPAQSGAVPTKTVYLADCGYKPQIKPATIILLCGDGAEGAKNLHWSDWGGQSAHATGTAWQHDCVPDCADGHDIFFKTSVVVTGARACADGTSEYATVTYTLFEPKKHVTTTVTYACVNR
jgi:hypothetical protein